MSKAALAMIILVLSASASWAMDKPCAKLTRGVANIATAPVEIIKQTRSYWIQGSAKTFHISAWIFCGFVKGMAMTIARVGSGAWDILSCPLPLPPDYQPLLKPDYVFQEWPHRQPGVKYHQLGQK